ncbi:MAG: AAA family ATPase [Nakamurella sp.]
MQLSGRPLLDNAADNALFAGRKQILVKLQQSLKAGYNCLVSGPPGSGKTSSVRALMYRLHHGPTPWPVIFVRANEAASAGDVLQLVLQSLDYGERNDDRPPASLPSVQLVDQLAERVKARLDQARVSQLIVIEDIKAAAGLALFGGVRDEVWQIDAQWVVTTSSSHAAGLRQPPADVFFETAVELGPLTPDEGADLLRRRMTDQEFADLWDFVPAGALETPRRLIEVARELTEAPAVGGSRLNISRGLEARRVALAAQSRPAQMLAQELEVLGWASASDERLLARLGWTRPRVVQVMAELELGGLVDMREESTGRGRPRKLYRLKPITEFVDPTDPGAPNGPESP